MTNCHVKNLDIWKKNRNFRVVVGGRVLLQNALLLSTDCVIQSRMRKNEIKEGAHWRFCEKKMKKSLYNSKQFRIFTM